MSTNQKHTKAQTLFAVGVKQYTLLLDKSRQNKQRGRIRVDASSLFKDISDRED